MNEVRTSGILEEVTEHSDSGVAFLSARLRFNMSDEVLLVVVGDAIDRFGPFDGGRRRESGGSHYGRRTGGLVQPFR